MRTDCFWTVGMFNDKLVRTACTEEAAFKLKELGCEIKRGPIVFAVGDDREELIYVHYYVRVDEILHVDPTELIPVKSY